jgi:hypothetical protein
MFLLHHDPNEAPPPDILEQHFAFARLARQRKAYVTSEALKGAEGTTIRKRGKQKPLIIDGPFVESKEVVGGYYVLDCRDHAEAIELGSQIPIGSSGAVEIRPVWEVPGWEYTLPGPRFS